jgi:plasmid maintenance system antidote protein VapI
LVELVEVSGIWAEAGKGWVCINVNRFDDSIIVNKSVAVNRSVVYSLMLLWQDESMGKAGQVLRQVLEEYEVSQYSLAMALNIERNSVYRWVNEKSDPSGETIVEIVRALKALKPESAKAFVERYLGNEVREIQEFSDWINNPTYKEGRTIYAWKSTKNT